MNSHSSTRPTSLNPGAAFAVAAFVLSMGAASTGCDPESATIPDDVRRNVMVIDTGIDPALLSFQGNVTAAHTVVCDPQADDRDVTDPSQVGDGQNPDIDALKQSLVAELGRPDDSCHLRSGIDPKQPVGQDIAAQRDRWNRALLNDDDPFAPEVAGVAERLEAELDTAPFHGTATAGMIAHDASDLRMVLVERALSSPDEAAGSITCVDQAQIDLVVTLLSAPEVRAAFLDGPQPSIDREMRELRSAHGVAVVNESFGRFARAAIEQLLAFAGCAPVELRQYFRTMNDLTRARDRAHPEPGVLFVRAAGNESAPLDREDDGFQCRPDDSQQVLVGAYDFAGLRASFTNFGSCVDVYAPGEPVVAPLPGDWMMLLAGTSFSAPLVVRHLLFSAPQPFAADTARAALLAERQSNGNLALSQFPRELVFDVNAARRKHNAAQSSSALTVETPGMGMGANMGMARARLEADVPALRRLLRPLHWAAGRHAAAGATRAHTP
jgi:hypothetical protein